MKRYLFAIFVVLSAATTQAQEKGNIPIADGLRYGVEMQATLSDDKTPLWLNANKYGLSSLEEENGYARVSVERPLRTDSTRRWGLGYGVDVALPYNFTSNFVVQQAYAELRWLHGTLTVGSKQYPMELKNNELSSGSQTLGINARPVPQARIALPEYWTLPFGNGWIHLKGHIAYGRFTDNNWQHEFTGKQSKFTDDVLYHSKAGYLKIGNSNAYCPFSIELGLEMAAQFGGTTYIPNKDGTLTEYKNGTGLKAYWQAFVPGGADANETKYKNVEGNQLGSWLMRLNWDEDTWRVSLYADKYFEDHSAMFQLDYDGYGTGDNWNGKEKHRYLLYDFKDMMLGAELKLKYGKWLRGIVFEYLYTKYQSGPIYHDHTPSISDHIGGRDNFYNHGIFPGWQHWGQVMGNPLFRSPIYNDDATVYVKDNRFMAFHVGVCGSPADNLSYRLLGTYQEGFGTYDQPYVKKHHNVSFLAEAEYGFSGKVLGGWSVRGAYAMDFGHILGNNSGFQLTISKRGIISK